MANPSIPAAPQAFTFDGRELRGFLMSFTGTGPRRFVVHESPKRAGGRVEDMNSGPRRVEVRLVFTGSQCARRFAEFNAAMHETPRGLLRHPIVGQWQAFCEGPQHDVDFSRAADAIEVRVAWTEDQLDAVLERDVPDVASAQQNTGAQLSKYQQTVAAYMGALTKVQTIQVQAVAKIDVALSQVALVTSPIDFMRSSVAATVGLRSRVVGVVTSIATKGQLLARDIAALIDQTSDLFEGDEAATGTVGTVETLLGVVQASAEVLIDDLIASTPTPAACADPVGDTDEAVAMCLVLDEAIRASKPPLVWHLVPELIDVISLATRLYPGDNAFARASEIMGLNRIPRPAAISAGTRLRIYAS